MTNYEKIKDIEISGATPFAGLSRGTLVAALKKNECRDCPAEPNCYESELPCDELILNWLEAEAR